MNTDCAYVIGSSHQVCQDYARTGDGYAILSDGCSSSPDTDVGARLLVVTAEKMMSRLHKRAGGGETSWARMVSSEAAARVNELHLPSQCLDATLMLTYAHDETVSVTMIGDGAVVWETRSGIRETLVSIYSENRPLYASYLVDAQRKAEWEATKPLMSLSCCREGRREQTVNGDSSSHSVMTLPILECRYVALFSDGIGSFTGRTEDGGTRSVSIDEVVGELTNFKSFKGAFAQRRMNAFLKQCAARGWKHHDDLSMAVIALGDE